MKMFKYGCMLAAVVLLAVMGLGPMVPSAEAQVTPTQFGTFTNLPTVMSNANASGGAVTTSNVTSIITVPQRKALNLWALFNTSGAGTSNMVWQFQVSPDGTNYTTTTPHQLVAYANGTTSVFHWTNIPASALEGVLTLKCSAMVNHSTNRNVYPTNLFYSWAN